ncbi:hypothetical protein EVAR_94509_1 [Eumeta japonica]|uniref:Uncharacterized protein n=1 Tax=Eumeta variegata TaxID=151549 RepID=A0A4C1UUP4_EUMVA|nr:hypothetical protein EVAR_94509_1 [Eumeta japonica]
MLDIGYDLEAGVDTEAIQHKGIKTFRVSELLRGGALEQADGWAARARSRGTGWPKRAVVTFPRRPCEGAESAALDQYLCRSDDYIVGILFVLIFAANLLERVRAGGGRGGDSSGASRRADLIKGRHKAAACGRSE